VTSRPPSPSQIRAVMQQWLQTALELGGSWTDPNAPTMTSAGVPLVMPTKHRRIALQLAREIQAMVRRLQPVEVLAPDPPPRRRRGRPLKQQQAEAAD
jgi:hypothetical protein